jgi:hypothetical protein
LSTLALLLLAGTDASGSRMRTSIALLAVAIPIVLGLVGEGIN